MEALFSMMQQYGLPVVEHEGNRVITQSGYVIEVEGQSLYKLIHLGDVIAPFDDVEEICAFVKTYS